MPTAPRVLKNNHFAYAKGEIFKNGLLFSDYQSRTSLKGIGIYYEYHKTCDAYNLASLMYLKRTEEQKQKGTKGTAGEATVIRGKSNSIEPHLTAPALVRTEDTSPPEVKYFYLLVTILLKMPIFTMSHVSIRM